MCQALSGEHELAPRYIVRLIVYPIDRGSPRSTRALEA